MNYKRYESLVNELIAKGVNFELDVFCRNSHENTDVDWSELASNYGYRKPKNGYFSRGGHFYLLLQKVYNKMESAK